MKLRDILIIVILMLVAPAWAAPQDLYVSSAGTNSVKRYDGVTGAYIGDFVAPGSGGLNQPQGLTFGPDGNLYVSSVSSGRVLKYNGSTGAFIGAFTQGPLLAFPGDMSWHNGSLYVSDFGGTAVHRYDALSGAYLGVFTAATVSGPDGLSWDTAGNLYVSCFVTNSVRKFSSTGELLGDFVAPGSVAKPLDSRFGADGNLYVNSFNTGRIKRYNGTTGAFISDFITGLGSTQGQEVGPDGKLYVGSYNGSFINRYDATTGTLLGTFAVGGGLVNPNNFAFAPLPGPIASLSVTPTLVFGTSSATGTVTLSSPAPVGGQVVTLASNLPNAVVPANVTVAASQTTATFSITTSNTTYSIASATISATIGANFKTATLAVYPANSALYVSQTIPSAMVAGQTYTVTLQYKNTGATTWDAAHSYRLQSRNPTNNTTWGVSRIPLTNAPVAPGGTGTFSAKVIAPASTGSYNMQWIPIQDSIGAGFGQLSPNVAVSVTKAVDAARFISQTSVTSLFAGADFVITNTMLNVGTSSWTTAGFYSMMSVNPNNNVTWGANRIAIPTTTASVAPNAQVAFSRLLTAPITPGTYTLQWQMDRGGVPFGDTTTLQTITVTQGPDNAQWISQTPIHTSMAPGATFTASFTMKNLGTATWDSTYVLSNVGSSTFGTVSMASVPTAPNATDTFTGSFTAPTTPGTYTLQYKMRHGATTHFGQMTQAVTIVVAADAAQFVSRSGATTLFAGVDFFATNVMKNVGTTTWSAAGGYSMTILPTTDAKWTAIRMNVPTAIAPNANLTANAQCTAPISPGTYTMQWQMAKNGVPFGEPTPVTNIIIVLGPDDAQYVGQTGIPATIVHGQTFNATITMKNLGTATWSGAYSLVPIGTNTFGVAGIAAVSTAQNANNAFVATFTAPATPGTYTFRMRIQHGSTKFGQPSASMTITVT